MRRMVIRSEVERLPGAGQRRIVLRGECVVDAGVRPHEWVGWTQLRGTSTGLERFAMAPSPRKLPCECHIGVWQIRVDLERPLNQSIDSGPVAAPLVAMRGASYRVGVVRIEAQR